MGKFKLIFLGITGILILVLAGEVGYYWATRQQTGKAPVSPICPTPETTPMAISPLIHPSVINWLEGTSPTMILRADFNFIISGKLENLNEDSLMISAEGVSKKFVFGKDLPLPKLEKIDKESSQVTPASKDEFLIGEDILMKITDLDSRTGKPLSIHIAKIVE